MRFAGTAVNSNSFINSAMNAAGNINAALAQTAPDWKQTSLTGMKTRAEDEMAGMAAAANLLNSGTAATGYAQQSAFNAATAEAQASANASTMQSQAMGDLLGGIGGSIFSGIGKMGGGVSGIGGGIGGGVGGSIRLG